MLYNTNISKTSQKKKENICTFVQVCAKRFRLCPTYKTTSDKGSLLASYYFSEIAQSKGGKKDILKTPLSRKRESLSWKIIPDADSKKNTYKQSKAVTKIPREPHLDSRIFAGPPLLLLSQLFIYLDLSI